MDDNALRTKRSFLFFFNEPFFQGTACASKKLTLDTYTRLLSSMLLCRSGFWLVAQVQGEKKSLSVTFIGEFYTCTCKEPAVKLFLTLNFKIKNSFFFALHSTHHEGKTFPTIGLLKNEGFVAVSFTMKISLHSVHFFPPQREILFLWFS